MTPDTRRRRIVALTLGLIFIAGLTILMAQPRNVSNPSGASPDATVSQG